MTRTILSKEEKKLLAELNLSPRTENALKNIWLEEEFIAPKKSIYSYIGSFIGIFLPVILIFLLGANAFHWIVMPKGFENLAFFIIWIFLVILPPIVSMVACSIIGELSFKGVELLVSNRITVVKKYFIRGSHIAIIITLIFRGDMITAVAVLISFIISVILNSGLRNKVRKALEELQ